MAISPAFAIRFNISTFSPTLNVVADLENQMLIFIAANFLKTSKHIKQWKIIEIRMISFRLKNFHVLEAVLK